MSTVPITYDRYGRIQYHPDYYSNQGKPWTLKDQNFLIESYAVLGPEQVSLALERTIHTVMTKAYELRKQGLMARPRKRMYHQRMRQSVKLIEVTA